MFDLLDPHISVHDLLESFGVCNQVLNLKFERVLLLRLQSFNILIWVNTSSFGEMLFCGEVVNVTRYVLWDEEVDAS